MDLRGARHRDPTRDGRDGGAMEPEAGHRWVPGDRLSLTGCIIEVSAGTKDSKYLASVSYLPTENRPHLSGHIQDGSLCQHGETVHTTLFTAQLTCHHQYLRILLDIIINEQLTLTEYTK